MKTLDIADRIAAALAPRDHKVWARRTYDMDGWETGEWKEKDNEEETGEEE